MPGQDLRAKDITIEASVNGIPELSFSVNSGTFDPGLGVDVYFVTGQSAPVVEGVNTAGGALTLDINPRNPGYMALLDVQRKKNKSNTEAFAEYRDYVITARFVSNFGADGRSRIVMPDCTISDGATNWSADPTAKATGSPTLTSPDWQLVGAD
jgi:hypothetical protein